jgi:hypothetical protein
MLGEMRAVPLAHSLVVMVGVMEAEVQAEGEALREWLGDAEVEEEGVIAPLGVTVRVEEREGLPECESVPLTEAVCEVDSEREGLLLAVPTRPPAPPEGVTLVVKEGEGVVETLPLLLRELARELVMEGEVERQADTVPLKLAVGQLLTEWEALLLLSREPEKEGEWEAEPQPLALGVREAEGEAEEEAL